MLLAADPFRPTRFISALSVRARIVVLALIPVIGFLANGIAFTGRRSGGRQAFDSVRRAGVLAEASRDFKGALDRMRHARAGIAGPAGLAHIVKAFAIATRPRCAVLERHPAIRRPGRHADNSPRSCARVAELQGEFRRPHEGQEKLGFNDNQGIDGKLARGRTRGRAASSTRHELADRDRRPAAADVACSTMRRSRGRVHARRRENAPRKAFFAEFDNFNKLFDGVIGADVMKTPSCATPCKAYADTFREWSRRIERRRPQRHA